MIEYNEHDFQAYGKHAMWVHFQAECIVADMRFDEEPDPSDIIPIPETPVVPEDPTVRARLLKFGGKLLQAFGEGLSQGGTSFGLFWKP